jgi:hypothetical protein
MENMSEKNQNRIEINKDLSFVEEWREGKVFHEGKEHLFWLIHPKGVDINGNEYEIDVRWFFARVPREVRALIPQIIDAFKSKAQDNATT